MRPITGGGATPIVPKNGRSSGTDDARCDFGGLALAIDRDHALPELRELVRQRAGERTLAVVAVADREIDREDAQLEHVARHRTVDEDRAR